MQALWSLSSRIVTNVSMKLICSQKLRAIKRITIKERRNYTENRQIKYNEEPLKNFLSSAFRIIFQY